VLVEGWIVFDGPPLPRFLILLQVIPIAHRMGIAHHHERIVD
jgi:hypothetical protein